MSHDDRITLNCLDKLGHWAKLKFIADEVPKKVLKRKVTGFAVVKWIQPCALFC